MEKECLALLQSTVGPSPHWPHGVRVLSSTSLSFQPCWLFTAFRQSGYPTHIPAKMIVTPFPGALQLWVFTVGHTEGASGSMRGTRATGREESYNESRGKALQVGGLHGQRVRSQKMQSKFRGSEGALVPTNTVVLEVVRDEVGWIGWLYSAGVGVKQGVVGTLFSSRCSGCLWWVPLGCGVFIEEARSRASRGLSPLSSRPASPTGQVSASLCSGRMEIPEPIPGLPGGDGVGGAKGQWPVETRCKVIPHFGHQVAPVSSAWAKLSRAEEQRGLRHPVRQPFSPWLQVDLPGSFKSNPCLSSIPRESDLVNLLEARAWVFS